MVALPDEQADEETTVYVVWRPPLQTAEEWIESCRPLRARSSTMIPPTLSFTPSITRVSSASGLVLIDPAVQTGFPHFIDNADL